MDASDILADSNGCSFDGMDHEPQFPGIYVRAIVVVIRLVLFRTGILHGRLLIIDGVLLSGNRIQPVCKAAR